MWDGVAASDGVSRLGLGLETSLETHFCESRSGRFQASRLWILQRNGLLKFLWFNDFLIVVFAGKKQPKHVEKIPNIWIKMEVRSDDDICFKCRQIAQILKSRVSVSEVLMKSRSRLEILTRSRSRRLLSRLHHWLPPSKMSSNCRFN